MNIEEAVSDVETHIEENVTDMFFSLRKAGQEMTPMVHMVMSGDGEPWTALVALNGNDKAGFADEIKKLAAEHKAVWLAFMSEGWAVMNPADDLLRPSQHPRRIECLILQIDGPLGARTVMWEIEGKGSEATLGKRSESSNAQGRFTGLLPKPEQFD